MVIKWTNHETSKDLYPFPWVMAPYFVSFDINIPCLNDNVLSLHLCLTIPCYLVEVKWCLHLRMIYWEIIRGERSETVMHKAKSKTLAFQTMLVLLEDSLSLKPFFIHSIHIFIFFPSTKIITCWKVLRIDGNDA